MKLTQHQVTTLRKLLREAVIARDRHCIRCGHSLYIDTSHVLSKGAYRTLQYDLNNVIVLCGHGSPNNCHHNFWHRYPQNSKTWFDRKYPDRAAYLAQMKNTLYKLPPYLEIKQTLIKAIDYYNKQNTLFTK